MSEQTEKNKQKLSAKEAIPKIERFCVYQERCQKEVCSKLYEFGLSTDDVMQITSELIKKGFLNEERFARAYAGGKFRQKKWGKNKIIRELKSRDISDYCINKAIKEIEFDDYEKTIEKLALKYLATHKAEKPWILKQKVLKHLISKGYEYDQCHAILDRLIHP